MDLTRRMTDLLDVDPALPFLQSGGVWTTVGDLRRQVGEIDAVLGAAGLGTGACVGVLTRNRPGHVAAIVSAFATGRCVVPVTGIQSDAAVLAELERLQVGVLLADPEDWERVGLRAHCAGQGVLGVVLPARPADPVTVVDGTVADLGRSGVTAPDGVAVLMPTSGTTGPPKRITYRYEHLGGALSRVAGYAAATADALAGPLVPRRRPVVAALAIAHIAGFWTVLQALAEARPIALLDRFEPGAWAGLVAEHRVAFAMIPPTAVAMVVDSEVPAGLLTSLKAVVCGTAPLDPDLGEAFTARYGVPVLTAYGATEFPGGLVGWSLPDYRQYHDTKRGSAGRPRPGIEIRVVDEQTGEVLPADERGIVSVRSPQSTAAAVDGWVRTNDYGRLDADGFLWVLGRADDAINRGGFKIVPQTVEAVLRAHPAVGDVAVVGIPDRRLGAVPVAAVTLTAPVTAADLVEWSRDRLTKYQVPTRVLLVDALPRTSSMKVSKDGVRELFTGA